MPVTDLRGSIRFRARGDMGEVVALDGPAGPVPPSDAIEFLDDVGGYEAVSESGLESGQLYMVGGAAAAWAASAAESTETRMGGSAMEAAAKRWSMSRGSSSSSSSSDERLDQCRLFVAEFEPLSFALPLSLVARLDGKGSAAA